MEQINPQRTALPNKQWMSGTALGTATLENLYAINRIYLDALSAGGLRQPASTKSRAMLESIVAGIGHLDRERRFALAHSPFSLFDARFSDGPYWRSLCGSVHEPV